MLEAHLPVLVFVALGMAGGLVFSALIATIVFIGQLFVACISVPRRGALQWR